MKIHFMVFFDIYGMTQEGLALDIFKFTWEIIWEFDVSD